MISLRSTVVSAHRQRLCPPEMPPPPKKPAAAAHHAPAHAAPVVEAPHPEPVVEAPPPPPPVTFARGRFVFDDGGIYEGDYSTTTADGIRRRHGSGRYAGPAFSYDGAWENDAFHGDGTFIAASGAKFVGEFNEGAFHGKGRYVWPDGATYEGGWCRNAMHGAGHFVAPSGELFAGEFHNGMYVRGKSHVAVR